MSLLSRLHADSKGATLVEFAFVAPVLLMLLIGILDTGHMVYSRAILQGAVQDAGRDAGLETGATSLDAIDSYVRNQVLPIVPSAQFDFNRQNYQTFNNVGRPEDFVDANSNGEYDATECFTDTNGSGEWDSDMGSAGLGGADDVVVYQVDMRYERLFPFWNMIGLSRNVTLSASTTLRNQPFAQQAERPETQVCPT